MTDRAVSKTINSGKIRTTMKTLRALLAVGVPLVILPSARADALFTEGFNYSTGTLATVGTGTWTGANANLAVTSGGLSYSGLADTSPSGNQLTVTSGVSAGTSAANFTSTAISSGTVYYSFLAQCTTLPTGNSYISSLLASGSPNGSADALSIYVGQQTAGSAFKIGVRHGGSGATYTSGSWATLGTVNLFVVGYTFNPNANDDTVSLWVNPTPGAAMPAADVTVTTGGTTADAASLQVVGFKAQSSASVGNWVFDTLRVDTSWDGVVPASVTVPEPSVAALAGLGALGLLARRAARK
jgi:hypothetical protein